MARDPIHHPIQSAIEDIWKAGHTPRIQVDARREDVKVPDSIKERWGARLVLDLDAAWPLNLEYTREGIAVDLAFSGLVTRCALPWAAIYVVLDRTTGRGVVIESHMPVAEDGGPPPEIAPAPLPERSDDASVTATSDEEAKRRRARFKVIDGGR